MDSFSDVMIAQHYKCTPQKETSDKHRNFLIFGEVNTSHIQSRTIYKHCSENCYIACYKNGVRIDKNNENERIIRIKKIIPSEFVEMCEEQFTSKEANTLRCRREMKHASCMEKKERHMEREIREMERERRNLYAEKLALIREIEIIEIKCNLLQ